MNILDAIVKTQNGAAVDQLASQFGVGRDQAQQALAALVPALAGGLHRNAQNQNGLTSLLSALSSGKHGQYLDNPMSLGDRNTVADGNGILGHILGSKDVSRAVASKAASQTGLSPDMMKQMLPLVATLLMGALSKNSRTAASSSGMPSFPAGLPGASGGGGGLLDMLTPLLDRNRDGSVMDDVTAMIGRFIKPS